MSNRSLLKTIAIVATLVALLPMFGGCKKRETETAAAPAQPAGGPTISAEPNPVPAGDGPGVTTISWDTGGDGAIVDVFLSVDGGEEKLFGKHSKDSRQIDWIAAGPVYEFRMYPTGEHGKVLGAVKVTRKRK